MRGRLIMTGKIRVRRDIAAMEAYVPVRPLEILSERLNIPVEDMVKMNANENPYGPHPAVRDAVLSSQMHIYPDPESYFVRMPLAEKLGVPFESVMMGSGADDLLVLMCLLMLEPGDTVVNCPPSFGVYPIFTEQYGGRIVDVPRDENFELDMDGIARAVEESRPKMLFICSPNNPSGNTISRAQLERLLELDTLIVLDEAYAAFTEPDMAAEFGPDHSGKLVAQYDNLVVLRTFSKWAGLAGLRVGYGIMPETVIANLWKIKPPYNVNVAAQSAAQSAIEHVDEMVPTVNAIAAERSLLEGRLAEIPYLDVYPSRSNFVLCRVDEEQLGFSAAELNEKLLQKGIIIRYYRSPARMRNHIRVSAGKPEDSDALLGALGAFVR